MRMDTLRWGLAIGVLAAQLATQVPLAQAPFPSPDGRINDFANLLDADQRERLTTMVREVEDETTAEIAVATVPSLDGMSVEEYANRLFAAWGVGKADADNGVLILVAPNEREMRIEVGYGLEPVLPDGLAGEIIRETFLPRFRDGDYAAGILDGTARIATIVRRNQPLSEEERQALSRGEDEPPAWLIVPFFGLFVAVGAGMAGSAVGARALSPMLFGVFFAGVPMLMSTLLVRRSGLQILLVIGAAAFVMGLRAARDPKTRASMRGPSSSAKSGWVWGSSGSSSGSGGSGGGWGGGGSSGGFGGGSSGGGGASGRW